MRQESEDGIFYEGYDTVWSVFNKDLAKLEPDQLRMIENNMHQVLTGKRETYAAVIGDCQIHVQRYKTKVTQISKNPENENLWCNDLTWPTFVEICSKMYFQEAESAYKDGKMTSEEMYDRYYYGLYERILDTWRKMWDIQADSDSGAPLADMIEQDLEISAEGLENMESCFQLARNSSNERIRLTFLQMISDMVYLEEAKSTWFEIHYVNPATIYISHDDPRFEIMQERIRLGDYDKTFHNIVFEFSEEDYIQILARGTDIEIPDPNFREHLEARVQDGDPVACSALAYDIMKSARRKPDPEVTIKAMKLWKQAADGGFLHAGYPLWAFNGDMFYTDSGKELLSESDARKYLFSAAETGDPAIRPVAVLYEIMRTFEEMKARNISISCFKELSPEMIAWYCRLFIAEREIVWINYFEQREELDKDFRWQAKKYYSLIEQFPFDCEYYNDIFFLGVIKHSSDLKLKSTEDQDAFFELLRSRSTYRRAAGHDSNYYEYNDYKEWVSRFFPYEDITLFETLSGRGSAYLCDLLKPIYDQWGSMGLY